VMRYDYAYDQLQRIMGMQSLTIESNAVTMDGRPVGWNEAQNAGYNEAYTYDGNENISTLKRNARLNGVSALMDNLTYYYGPGADKNNRLRRVADAVPASTVFANDFENLFKKGGRILSTPF
jgi:hypothetical protein